jgi:hypothetical protein
MPAFWVELVSQLSRLNEGNLIPRFSAHLYWVCCSDSRLEQSGPFPSNLVNGVVLKEVNLIEYVITNHIFTTDIVYK